MSFVCETRVAKWAQDNNLNIPRDVIRQMGRMIDEAKAKGLSDDEFTAKVDELYTEHIEEYLLGRQLNELRALEIRETAVEGIKQADRSKPEGLYEAVRAWINGGGIRGFLGSNRDIRDMRGAVQSEFMNFWKKSIGTLEKIVKTGGLDREIFQELYAIRHGLTPGESGSKMAVQAARAIHDLQKLIFSKKQKFNALMRENSDYIMQRIHNRELISQTDKTTWVNDAMLTYGKKSYVEVPMDEKRALFEEMYDNIVNGRHSEVTDIEEFMRPFERGHANIYSRMSRSRKLVADSWEAEFEYNKKYGHGTVLQTVHRTMTGAAHDIAVLQKFGAMPRYTYEDLLARVMMGASEDEKRIIMSNMTNLQAEFNQAMGTADAQARTNQAKWFNSLRAIEMMAHLGKTFLRVFPDIAVSSLMIRGINGRNVFQNAAEIFGEYMKQFTSTEARNQALESIWMFSKTAHGKFMDDIGAVDYKGVHGFIGRMAQDFGKWNLMDRHTDSMRAATGVVASRHLARYAEKSFGELDVNTQGFLKRYGIDNAEWFAIRAAGLDLGGGRKIIDSDAIDLLDDNVIMDYIAMTGRTIEDEEIAQSLIDGTREELSLKVGTLINNMANIGSTTAGSRQAAFMYKGTDINTTEGIIRRALFQFQGAMFTTVDAYRRAYVSGKTLRGDMSGVAQAMVLGTFLWTLGKLAEEAMEGREMPDVTDPGFIAQAMLGSGALGYAGEVMLSEVEANSPYEFALRTASSMTGPLIPTGFEAIGTVWQGLESGVDAAFEPEGKPTEFPTGSIAKLLSDHIPGRNMLYLKGVLDYYLFNELRDFADTGYLGQLEKRTYKKRNIEGEPRGYNFFAPTDSTFLGMDL